MIYIYYVYNIISNNYVNIFLHTYQLNFQILIDNKYFELLKYINSIFDHAYHYTNYFVIFFICIFKSTHKNHLFSSDCLHYL